MKKNFIKILNSIVILSVFLLPLYSSKEYKTMWDRIMEEQSYIHLNRGINYLNNQDYLKASVEFLKAIEKSPTSMAYALYGASLYWMGDNPGSISNYDKAIEMDPNNDTAWQLKGISLARDMKLDMALDCFKKALEINDKRSDLLMNIGSVYFSLNNITEAIRYFKNAIKLDPRNPLLYYQLGLVYFNTADYDLAISNFKKAYQLKDDFEDAILWLGISYEKTGNIKDAQNMYEKAISLKPYDFFARYKLARIINEKEKIEKIIEPCFELVINNNNNGIGLAISYTTNNNIGDISDTNPLINSIIENINQLKEDEEANINIDIIETKKPELEKIDGELTSKLKERFNQYNLKLKTKNYFIPSGSEKNKIVNKMISDIKDEINQSNNYRINFSINKRKTSQTKTQDSLQYLPRSVGNDMGLWLMGNHWIEVVEEDMESTTNNIIKALGLLLIGKFDESRNIFINNARDYEMISELGLGVIEWLSGYRDIALEKMKKAAWLKSKSALKNIKHIETIYGNK